MQGIITALITPFYKGQVDEESLQKLVQHQLQAGVRAFVINGSTGESPTLTVNEVEHIFRIVNNCTREHISKFAPKHNNTNRDLTGRDLIGQDLTGRDLTNQHNIKLILGAGLNSTQKTLQLIKSLSHASGLR